MSCHLYLSILSRVIPYKSGWPPINQFDDCSISDLKNRHTLIEQSITRTEQSQYFQGCIRADPSKLGAVCFVNDLCSGSVVAKVLIHMPPFSG